LVVTIDKLNQLPVHLEYTGKQILAQHLVFDGSVEALNHSICPGMFELDRAMLNVVLFADLVKRMDLLRPLVFRERLVAELEPIVHWEEQPPVV